MHCACKKGTQTYVKPVVPAQLDFILLLPQTNSANFSWQYGSVRLRYGAAAACSFRMTPSTSNSDPGCSHVLGRVPLTPLFLLGNSPSTIPHQLRQHRRDKFPHGLADATDASGKKGSNVYEVKQWLSSASCSVSNT